MKSGPDRVPPGDAAFAKAFARVYPVAVLGAGALLTVAAAVWACLERPVADTRLAVAAGFWLLALLAVAVMVARRREPTAGVSIGSQVGALIGSAAVFGLLQGTLAGVFTGIAVLVFFLVVVGATVLRADAPRKRSGPAFD